jgi:hypothetical protein
MKRLALVTAAVAALVAAPVLAMPQRLPVTHMGVPLTQPLAAGDIVVGISFFDGTTMLPIDGVVIQPKRRPTVCGPSLAPAEPEV